MFCPLARVSAGGLFGGARPVMNCPLPVLHSRQTGQIDPTASETVAVERKSGTYLLGRRRESDRGDVGLIESHEHFCFPLKTRKPISIICDCLRQNLDGYVAPELAVVRLIYLSHSASANGGEDFVRAEGWCRRVLAWQRVGQFTRSRTR